MSNEAEVARPVDATLPEDSVPASRSVETPATPTLPSGASAPSGFAAAAAAAPGGDDDETVAASVSLSEAHPSAATTAANASDNTTTTPPNTRGVCPVKPQYIRNITTTHYSSTNSNTTTVTRVTLDAEGKTRGMVKGSAREHGGSIEGTLRPTFEGEVNFLNGAVLSRVKASLRIAQGKRARPPDERGRNDVNVEEEGATPRLAEVGAAAAAADDESHGGQQQRDVRNASPAGTTTGMDEDDGQQTPGVQGPPPSQQQQQSALVSSSSSTATASVAQRREVAAGEIPIFTTTPEIRRAHAAQRQTLFGGGKLILAPLTTVGNLPFRRICVGYGADVTLGEMAVVHNLNHTQKSEWSLLRRHESESVFGLQIAVSRPGDAAIFAKTIEASGFSYDYIDINCGCPVDKIVQNGCGCGLWEKKSRLREVVQVLTKFQSKPVTIKCRIGADESFPTLHHSIGEYEGWGASAVTIHGRSKKQRYTKLANWEYIQRCATLTNLPVIGNGDVMSVEDAQARRLQCPNVSSMMIGRGALIKPWVFEEIKSGVTRDPSSQERLELLKTFVSHGLAHWGADEKGVATTRRFLCEWLSFLCRYVPTGLLERLPQRINERPPLYDGRDDLETLMASDSVVDWIRITEMLLGPAGPNFRFTPKHRSNAYSNVVVTAATTSTSSPTGMAPDGESDAAGGEDEG